MEKYNLGLVNASLYPIETALLVKKYRETGSWETVRKQVLDDNLLQKTHSRTSKKISGEIIKRISAAYSWEIEAIADSEDPQDWKFITLAFTARFYRILRDVIIDVIYHKWQGMDYVLENYEIPAYIDSQKVRHPELMDITERCMEDLLSTIKRNIKDGGLLAASEGASLKITRPAVSQDIRGKYLEHGSQDDLKLLLAARQEIKKAGGK